MIHIVTGDHGSGKTKYISTNFPTAIKLDIDYAGSLDYYETLIKYISDPHDDELLYLDFPEFKISPKLCYVLGKNIGKINKNMVIETQSNSLLNGIRYAIMISNEDIPVVIIDQDSGKAINVNSRGFLDEWPDTFDQLEFELMEIIDVKS
jgi:predicted ATPase